MKEVKSEIKRILKPLKYINKGNNFYKIESNFYRLINLQHGVFGDYFFINIALHPIGLPGLITDKLIISELPKSHECIFNSRIEQISNTCMIIFKNNIAQNIGMELIPYLKDVLIKDVEPWFNQLSSYEYILHEDNDEQLLHILNTVPLIKSKALLMLKYFCAKKICNYKKANQLYNEYQDQNKDLNFKQVDDYLFSL